MVTADNLNLIPTPMSFHADGDTYFQMPELLSCNINSFSLTCLQVLQERFDFPPPRLSSDEYWLYLQQNKSLAAEEYELRIRTTRIEVTASTETGVLHALTTLFILTEDGHVPCCEIRDYPLYPHRGLSLDCARTFFTVEEIKKILENMGLLKMNIFHWHLSDDQGYRLESQCYPKLNRLTPEYYTHDEVRDIISYAALRGMKVLPEIDFPGHVRAILAAYPQLSCKGKATTPADSAGIFSEVLCVSQPSVYEFIETLLQEITPLFPYEYFHIGNDEVPTIEWEECPQCQAAMQASGHAQARQLQIDFARRVIGILQKLGKKPIVWNDLLLAGEPEDLECKVQYWTVNQEAPMKNYADSGKAYIYSDMFFYYFDYPHSMSPLQKVYCHTPAIGGQFCADNPGFEGIEAAIWAEHIKTEKQLENLLFPRVFAVAQTAWSGNKQSYRQFIRHMKKNVSLAEDSGIQITPKNWWNPKGLARRREAIAYFRQMHAGVDPAVREESWRNSPPSKKFMWNFFRRFFRPWDIFHVLYAMRK